MNASKDVTPSPDMVCGKCGKRISDDEYSVNWGWCHECLKKDFTEYLKEKGRFDCEKCKFHEFCQKEYENGRQDRHSCSLFEEKQ